MGHRHLRCGGSHLVKTAPVFSDKNSRNYGLYQGTPSGVPQRSAHDDRQGL